ncbi:MAG TPA: GerMN domain-containing protein [Acidimicrobiales bacterium]|nr:GerMN domain-containing protein [Acidimicrobiales bacterium]
MTRPRSRSGRLLAGAATLALVVSAACGIPTGGGPTVIAKADVPFHLLNPAPSTTISSAVPPEVGVSEPIFLVAPSQHLVSVSRDVQIPATLSEILGALLEGPTSAESAYGLQSFLTGSRTQVVATVTGGIATVNFTTNPIQVVGPDQTLAIAQVVFTATQQPGVTGVTFQIAGQPIEIPTANGVQVPGPVDRSSYVPQAPLP